MLRITQVESLAAGPTVKLEGKLLGPWVLEVRAACQQAAAARGHSRLDLSAVTYVDSDGEKLLDELLSSGTELVDCSRFIAALLHREAKT